MRDAILKIDQDSPEDEMRQCLTFMLSGKVYGLDILNIKEIIEYGELTEVPMTPDFISGVINLRGSVVPVIDLNKRFLGKAIECSKRTSIIILEVNSADLVIEIGVTVDIVNEVLDIHSSEIEPPPKMGNQIQTNFINGMAKVDDKFLILLDVESLLSNDELSIMGGIDQYT
ncbi:Positive regulator of CheA protein activity (CheW) [hydrothermal vent metagenome]|uniref:Positive regulator of CheA protein activity (CheW) n=1 Tax=hydrothermal vent metagenome TaxID=652676 RepID=A0A3B0YGP6_9ZZZZ